MTHDRQRWLLVVVAALSLGLVGCGSDDPETKGTPAKPGKAGKSSSSSKTGTKQGPLGIAAGKIVYQQTGQPAGTRTAWFQDHGATVVVVDDMSEPLGVNAKMIWRDGDSLHYDYRKSSLHKSRLRIKVTELDWNGHLTAKSLESVGYKRLGTEDMAGLTCDVWENEGLGVKAWVHKRLLIKEVNSLGGKHRYTITAESFEALDAIPASAFETPTK